MNKQNIITHYAKRSFIYTTSLVCLCLISSSIAIANTNTSQIHPGEIPEGLSATEWDNVKTQITAKQYLSHLQQDGSIKAINTAHNLKVHYQTNGITSLTAKDNQDYVIDMKLTGLGYQHIYSFNQPTQVSHTDNVVTYQWSNELKEIWTNSSESLEQWFILQQRPLNPSIKNDANNHQQPLNIQLSLDTDLTISQEPDGLHFRNLQGIDISYIKLKVWDSNGTILPSKMLLTDNTITLQIEDSQAQYPLTIDPLFQQQAYLKASNAEAGDEFGFAVAVSADTLVVGAILEDGDSSSTAGSPNNLAVNSGAAYVFIRSGSTWTQQAYLKASNAETADEFGYSVAVSADTLVVGARLEDGDSSSTVGSPNNLALDAGAAYVFTILDLIFSDGFEQTVIVKLLNYLDSIAIRVCPLFSYPVFCLS